MTRSLNGRVAVVTGAGSGIGRAIAIRLAEDTARVAIWDINGEGAAETVKLIEAAGGTAIAITADCSDKAAIQAAAAETRAKLGPVAILVNNAGIAPFTPFLDIEDELFDKTIRINLRGPFLLTREVLPDMLGGRLGTGDQHHVFVGAERLLCAGALCLLQGRTDGHDEGTGAGVRRVGRDLQHGATGLYRHTDAARRTDRRGSLCQDAADEARRQARGYRCGLRLSGIRGSELHHRPDDQHQWRALYGVALMRLAGKIAIVTGAAGGMGEASALLFAREGAKVAAVDLEEAGVAPVVEAIRAAGGTAIAIGADISKAADVLRIAARTEAELGLPNVLFNNAGVDTEGKQSILDISEEAFDRVVEVNLKGAWLMIKHIAPRMIAAGGGSIVNTASIGALTVCSTAGYCASKAGVVMLSKVAAVELGRHGIRVNALCPGATETPMARHQREEMARKGLPSRTR
jgi:NAD(P)-dependent dehydrogenase (short-subunit alcohol dehydrogenase family)